MNRFKKVEDTKEKKVNIDKNKKSKFNNYTKKSCREKKYLVPENSKACGEACKQRPSLIPRPRFNNNVFGTRENYTRISTTLGDKSIVDRTNVQIHHFNITQDNFPETSKEPKFIELTRPIPKIEHIYSSDFEIGGIIQDNVLITTNQQSERRSGKSSDSSSTDNNLSRDLIKLKSVELINEIIKEANKQSNSCDSPFMFRTTDENIREWLSSKLNNLSTDHSKRKHPSAELHNSTEPVYFARNKATFRASQNYYYNGNQSKSQLKEILMKNKPVPVGFCVENRQTTVMNQINLKQPPMSRSILLTKRHTDIQTRKLNKSDAVKPLKYFSTPNSVRRKFNHKLAVPSFIEYPSEVLQKTTSFEEGTSKNQRGSLSSNDELKRVKEDTEANKQDYISSSIGSSNLSNVPSASTSNTIKQTHLSSNNDSDTNNINYAYGHCVGKDSKKKGKVPHKWNRRGKCKKCHVFKVGHNPRSYPLNPQTRVSIGRICKHRLNRVWKKTTERIASWSKSSAKCRKCHVINYLRGSLVWENANVQTTIMTYKDTGTDAATGAQTLAGIAASVKKLLPAKKAGGDKLSKDVQVENTLYCACDQPKSELNFKEPVHVAYNFDMQNLKDKLFRSHNLSKNIQVENNTLTCARDKSTSELGRVNQVSLRNNKENFFYITLSMQDLGGGVTLARIPFDIRIAMGKVDSVQGTINISRDIQVGNNVSPNTIDNPQNQIIQNLQSQIAQAQPNLDSAHNNAMQNSEEKPTMAVILPSLASKETYTSVSFVPLRTWRPSVRDVSMNTAPIHRYNLSDSIEVGINTTSKSSLLKQFNQFEDAYTCTMTSYQVAYTQTIEPMRKVSTAVYTTTPQLQKEKPSIVTDTTAPCRRNENMFVTKKGTILSCTGTKITSVSSVHIQTVSRDAEIFKVYAVDRDVSPFNVIDQSSFNGGSHHSLRNIKTEMQPERVSTNTSTQGLIALRSAFVRNSYIFGREQANADKANCYIQSSSQKFTGAPDDPPAFRIGQSELMSLRTLDDSTHEIPVQVQPMVHHMIVGESKTSPKQIVSTEMTTSKHIMNDRSMSTLAREKNETHTQYEATTKDQVVESFERNDSGKVDKTTHNSNPDVVISSNLNAAKWMKGYLNNRMDEQQIVNVSQITMTESTEREAVIQRENQPNDSENEEIQPQATFNCETKTCCKMKENINSNNLDSTNDLEVVSNIDGNCKKNIPVIETLSSEKLAQDIQKTLHSEGEAEDRSIMSKESCKETVSGTNTRVKEISIQAFPSIVDRATEYHTPLKFKKKSAAVLTPRHFFPASICRNHSSSKSECSFVYGSSRCIIHGTYADIMSVQVQTSQRHLGVKAEANLCNKTKSISRTDCSKNKDKKKRRSQVHKESCGYYSTLRSNELLFATKKLKKRNSLPDEKFVNQPKTLVETPTEKASGRRDANCQTKYDFKNISESYVCILTSAISEMDIRGRDKDDLRMVYYILASIEGRMRRLRDNIHY